MRVIDLSTLLLLCRPYPICLGAEPVPRERRKASGAGCKAGCVHAGNFLMDRHSTHIC